MRLEHRITLLASGATLAALVSLSVWSSHRFGQEYGTALESRSLAIATSLAVQVQRLLGLGLRLEELVGFEEQCQEAVAAYGGIEQAMVVDPGGTILFHNAPDQRGRRVVAPELLAAVERDRQGAVAYREPDGRTARAAAVPILDPRGAHQATVLVVFPAALVEGKARRMALSTLGVGLLVLALGAAALVAALSASLTKPLARFIQSVERMHGDADPSRRLTLPPGGDLRRLGDAFNRLLADLQETTVSRAELAQAMRVLERTEERYRRLVETAPSGILVDCGDRLVYVNPSGLQLLGARRPEELLGLPFLRFVHPESRAPVEAHVRALLAGGAPAPVPEVRLVRLDGVIRQVELTSIAFDYAGAPAVQLVLRDVTEHRAMQAQLVATGRLASLGTMARGMAHEINNPLTGVISGLQFLAADLGEVAAQLPPERLEDWRSAVEDALLGATRVRRLIGDLQAYSRDQVLLDAVDLARVLELAASMASSQLRDRARLVKAYGPLPRVVGNEARLGQVFLNLLLNAAQAIPAGLPGDNEVRLEATVDDGWVEVEIRDSGCGIPAGVRDRIFDPFFTTRGVGEGAGLGLFVAHGLVKGMGGRIRFDSHAGGGTSFFVALAVAGPGPADGAG